MPNIRSAALRSRYAWARQAASQYRRPATESFGSPAPHRGAAANPGRVSSITL